MISEKYETRDIEAKWQARWEAQCTYAWNPDEPRTQSYIIDTPPPTVSGYLHIGHVYSYTQTDLIARYRRMAGENVFYPMGFDDNGLPTERLVEKTRGIRAVDMSREDFIAICHEVARESEQDFRKLFRNIALSVDWSLEYQTISAHCRKISQLSALDLFQKDHLYRRLQPTLWDPVDRTALAQAEVVEKETPGTMWQVVFGLERDGEIVVGTTRPELIGACCALMIHPEHPRRYDLEGTRAISPLFLVPVPIIVDTRVDPEIGSGVVMCCTFGDTTDIEWWRTYNLPTRVILDKAGRLTEMPGLGGPDWPSLDLNGARSAAAGLAGSKVTSARQKIVDMLRARAAVRSHNDLIRMVPCAERSGAPLEILVTPQWFVRTLDKKDALLQKGREIQWFPDYMRARYESWVENLKWDWCISRQRYFGVPFPFWYSKRAGEEGHIIPARPEDLPVNPLVDLPRGYAAHEVEPDPDVMDTWATSSVSPQINSYGIAPGFSIDSERHRKLFPATMRPQAHEIIRTWAFYTILKALLHEGQIPWKHIAISGWCLAPDRSKMSKSKGNVVTPDSLLERYGADAIRYWTATSKLGNDTALSEDVLKQGRRLVTKLWNASRFTALQLEGFDKRPSTPLQDLEQRYIVDLFDRWILSRVGATVATATSAYEAYEYADALRAIERFFWSDFCDNYLELVKGRAYGDAGTPANQRSARYTLWHCLEATLRLLAPTLPHVTEEIYSALFPSRCAVVNSIHARGNWPRAADQVQERDAERIGGAGIGILALLRKLKSQRNISLKTPVLWCKISSGSNESAIDRSALDKIGMDLSYAIGTSDLSWADAMPNDEVTTTEDGSLRVAVGFAE
jgi:valyl-tRNA synthetase